MGKKRNGILYPEKLPARAVWMVLDYERENRQLRQANEIWKKATACFAQAELDRPSAYDWFHQGSPKCPWGRADLPGLPILASRSRCHLEQADKMPREIGPERSNA